MSKKSLFGDIAVLLIILCLCFFMMLFWKNQSKSYDKVNVYADGKLVNTLMLSNDTHYSPNGGNNIICIENKKVYMSYSTCQNQSCVLMESIDENGGFIACVPNRIYVCTDSKNSIVDAVAG